MRDLSEINPHLALWQSETFESDGERAWLRCVNRVEFLLGFEVDNDEATSGYSQDMVYDLWEGGHTADEIVDEILEILYRRAYPPAVA